MKNKRLENGYTFLELLIAIIIISGLFTVFVLNIHPEEKKKIARDNKRLNDINMLERAVNEHMIDNGTYPDAINTLRTSTVLPLTALRLDSSSAGWILGSLSGYLSRLPLDPLNNDTYNYKYIHDLNSYELNARLESLSQYSANDGGNDSNVYEVGNRLTLITP